MTPDPGFYPDVPDHEYHSWRAVSASYLKKLNVCPLVAKHYKESDDTDTKTLKLGRVYHDCVLRFEHFKSQYVVTDACDRIMGKNTKRPGEKCGNPGLVLVDGKWRCGVHTPKGHDMPKNAITQSEYDTAMAMRKSILMDKQATEIVEGFGHNEASIVWRDEATGVLCKARIDRWTAYQGRSTHVDLKGTQAGRAEPDKFGYDVHKYGYDVQAAFYLEGAQAIDRLKGETPKDRRFVFIAIEKKAPHPCGVYELDTETLESGSRKIRRLLNLHQRCEKEQRWPGYTPNGIGWVGVPTYGLEPMEDGEIL